MAKEKIAGYTSSIKSDEYDKERARMYSYHTGRTLRSLENNLWEANTARNIMGITYKKPLQSEVQQICVTHFIKFELLKINFPVNSCP